MTVINYTNLEDLWKASIEKNEVVLETGACYYFRIFVNKQCTEFHSTKK